MKSGREILKKLPRNILRLVKKGYYFLLIKRGKFVSLEKEFEILKKIVPEGSRVVDIGANIGHYTILLSKLVGHNGRVLAFEPIPKTLDYLVSNIYSANTDNVTLINAAISGDSDEIKFTIPGDNLYRSYMDPNGNIDVMCFPLAVFLPKNWNFVFLKVDAEGCDESVIKDSIAIINSYRPTIMAELSLERAELLVDTLTDYSVRAIKGSHNKFFVPNERIGSFPIVGSPS
jgi:FkbM family methyltransferase